jgi:hypothetical protein
MLSIHDESSYKALRQQGIIKIRAMQPQAPIGKASDGFLNISRANSGEFCLLVATRIRAIIAFT